jgi:hypothetical protein
MATGRASEVLEPITRVKSLSDLASVLPDGMSNMCRELRTAQHRTDQDISHSIRNLLLYRCGDNNLLWPDYVCNLNDLQRVLDAWFMTVTQRREMQSAENICCRLTGKRRSRLPEESPLGGLLFRFGITEAASLNDIVLLIVYHRLSGILHLRIR